MADVIKYYINNQLANPPKDWQATTLNINYDNDIPGQEVSFSSLDFVRENSTLIQNFISQYGVFTAIPFKKEVNSTVVFDGYIYLSDNPQISAINSTFVVKEAKSIDWLTDVADNFDFNYLHKTTNFLTGADFLSIPYVIEKPLDYTALALAQLTVFTITTEITSAVEKIAELSAESANPFEATAIIRLSIYIAYLAILLVTLIKTLNDIARLLIQPVKYHAGMSVKRHFEVACNYLGINFSSSIPELNAVILPQKYSLPTDSNGIFGFQTSTNAGWEGFYKGTFGDFIREMKKVFRGKIVLVDNTLYFEREDYVVGQPQYQMPPLENYDDKVSYNTTDLKANYILTFAPDLSDEHTILEYQGTSYQVITSNANLPNNFITTLTGLEEVRLNFSLGKRKNELSTVEKVFDFFYKAIGAVLNTLIRAINLIISAINRLIRVVNGIVRALRTIGINLNFQFPTIRPLQTSGFGNTIQNRLGMLKLTNDYFNNPKLLNLTDNNKLAVQQYTAKYLYDNYHFITSFLPNSARPKANQYKIYPAKLQRFKEADYLLVKNNKFVKLFDGTQAEIIRCEWNDWEQTAEIEYKVNELYDTNLIEYKYEPTGA